MVFRSDLFYPTISNNKELGCLFSDYCKKKVLWNYDFEMFEYEINNTNKNGYSNFHTYTEAKNMFILAEERKSRKNSKISETKKSKYNSSGAANSGNNKNKQSKQKKNYQKSNTSSSASKNPSMKYTYCGQDGQFSIK